MRVQRTTAVYYYFISLETIYYAQNINLDEEISGLFIG